VLRRGGDPAGAGAVVPRPRGGAADARLGLDALHAPAGHLRAALRLRAAGVGDLYHLAVVQPGQRRPARGHGRAHMRGLGKTGSAAGAAKLAGPRPKLDAVPPGDPRDRGGKIQPMLAVNGLKKHFPIRGGLLNRRIGSVRAVDDVSFVVLKGETLGIVGESGCGKSTLARLLM